VIVAESDTQGLTDPLRDSPLSPHSPNFGPELDRHLSQTQPSFDDRFGQIVVPGAIDLAARAAPDKGARHDVPTTPVTFHMAAAPKLSQSAVDSLRRVSRIWFWLDALRCTPGLKIGGAPDRAEPRKELVVTTGHHKLQL